MLLTTTHSVRRRPVFILSNFMTLFIERCFVVRHQLARRPASLGGRYKHLATSCTHVKHVWSFFCGSVSTVVALLLLQSPSKLNMSGAFSRLTMANNVFLGITAAVSTPPHLHPSVSSGTLRSETNQRPVVVRRQTTFDIFFFVRIWHNAKNSPTAAERPHTHTHIPYVLGSWQRCYMKGKQIQGV